MIVCICTLRISSARVCVSFTIGVFVGTGARVAIAMIPRCCVPTMSWVSAQMGPIATLATLNLTREPIERMWNVTIAGVWGIGLKIALKRR